MKKFFFSPNPNEMALVSISLNSKGNARHKQHLLIVNSAYKTGMLQPTVVMGA
jgi:hypothetical protein